MAGRKFGSEALRNAGGEIMNKLGHTVGAFASIGATAYVQYRFRFMVDFKSILILYPAIYVGNFLPDLHAEYSYIRSKLPIVPSLYTNLQKLLSNTTLSAITKHRGALLHSVWTVLAFTLLALLSSSNVAFLGFAIGCFMHHILDMATPAGLRYLYPLRFKI